MPYPEQYHIKEESHKRFFYTVLDLFLHSPVFAILRITIMSGDEKRGKNILSVYIKLCHIWNQNNIKALHTVYREKRYLQELMMASLGNFYTSLSSFKSRIKGNLSSNWVAVPRAGKGCGKNERKSYVNNLKVSVWGSWSKNYYGNHEYLVISLVTIQIKVIIPVIERGASYNRNTITTILILGTLKWCHLFSPILVSIINVIILSQPLLQLSIT